MPQEKFLILHMHEMLSYLNRQGVVTILTMAQHGLVGDMRSPVDATYLSDTILLLRFFEAKGQVRRAMTTMKKRAGAHEPTIREYQIGPGGIRVGQPLEEFQGVLRGVPAFVGKYEGLLRSEPSD
jgi:circadian clock protein KaiC